MQAQKRYLKECSSNGMGKIANSRYAIEAKCKVMRILDLSLYLIHIRVSCRGN